MLARVRDGLGKGVFDDLEKSFGVVFVPDGLLADLELRAVAPPSTYVRDPMHVMLSGGSANVEIYAFLRSVAVAVPGFSWKTVRDFVAAAWHFPGRISNVKLSDVFSDSRETASKSAEIFKARASEVLSVYPICDILLRLWWQGLRHVTELWHRSSLGAHSARPRIDAQGGRPSRS